jgi:integrase
MSRNYGNVRSRQHRVYSVEDVMGLYAVCRNTVSNWVTGGLSPVDQDTPQLFRGAELARFHTERRERSRILLRSGEFKCLGCKMAVFPELATLVVDRSRRRPMAMAVCPDCRAWMNKLLDDTECNRLLICLDTNTNLALSDEDKGHAPAGIGKETGLPVPRQGGNDRVIYRWQGFAGRYDPKTCDAHLAAIREFERFLNGKEFTKVTTTDAGNWRDEMVTRAGRPKSEGGLSRSSVRHRASHLAAFFDWLSGERGTRHLSAVREYFALPRAFHADGDDGEPRAYPSLEEAEAMLGRLPGGTIKDRRDRAIFAIAFVSGLREQALISLRLLHVDVANRRVHHDGRILRAKNGKSFHIKWFPKTDAFQVVLRAWIDEMRAAGLEADDALFPDAHDLNRMAAWLVPGRPAISPMRSAAAVDAVFRLASKGAKQRYTPHSARHCLAQLGDQLCRTGEERKAWSMNFGHESESITWKHHGNVSLSRRAEIFEAFEVIEHVDGDMMRQMRELQQLKGGSDVGRAIELVGQFLQNLNGTSP